jgi:transposase
MRFYTGIDLHTKESVVCFIDDKDTIRLRQTLPNHLENFLSPLHAFTPKPAVAVEATLNWYWLVDGLQVIKKADVKTDNKDAFHLAWLLRLEALPESYVCLKQKRPIRDLLRKRRRIVSLRTAFNRCLFVLEYPTYCSYRTPAEIRKFAI